MKRKFFYLVTMSPAVTCANARRLASGPLELAVYPAKAPEPAEKYSLLPKADRQIDADVVPLYEKAIQALPRGRTQGRQTREWLQLLAEQSPQDQVEEAIQRAEKPSI